MKELIEQMNKINLQLEERLLTINKYIDNIENNNKNTTTMTVKEYKVAINELVKNILTNEEFISNAPHFYKDEYLEYRNEFRSNLYKDRIIISTTTEIDSDNTNIYEFFLEKNDIQSSIDIHLLEIIYDTLSDLEVSLLHEITLKEEEIEFFNKLKENNEQ